MHKVHSRTAAVRMVQAVLLVIVLWLLVAHLVSFELSTFHNTDTRWLLPVRARLIRLDVGWRNTIQRAVNVHVLQPLAAQGAYDRALQVCATAARLDVSGMVGAGAYYCQYLNEEKAMYEYCALNCTAGFCQQIFSDMCG